MDKETVSLMALHEFLEKFDLMDGYGNAMFDAIVTGTVDGKPKTIESNVQVLQRNYPNDGTINILDSKIDSFKFPTYFVAKYQEYIYIPDYGLKINGHHKKNPNIGIYCLSIIPK